MGHRAPQRAVKVRRAENNLRLLAVDALCPRADALGRLRICAAEDCEDVLIDLSKNSSKRYCDTGNCGNRTNVAAYRARKRQQSA